MQSYCGEISQMAHWQRTTTIAYLKTAETAMMVEIQSAEARNAGSQLTQRRKGCHLYPQGSGVT